jgi:hypothetical protein
MLMLTNREHLSDWVPVAWAGSELDYEPLRWRCRICGETTDEKPD